MLRPILALGLVGFGACSNGSAGKIELVDAPATQDVAPVIAQEVARAQRDHKKLVVYVGASWCEPCTHFHDAIVAGKLDSVFGDMRMLVFDADRDNRALERAGYIYELIPLFAIPNADGRSSRKQIEGSIKGANAVDQISPNLRALLDRSP